MGSASMRAGDKHARTPLTRGGRRRRKRALPLSVLTRVWQRAHGRAPCPPLARIRPQPAKFRI